MKIFKLCLLSAALILVCLYSISCRYNRVSVVIKNVSDYDFNRITVRFGDTLQIFKDLKKGQRCRRFWSNQTYAKGYTKVVLPGEDTLVYYPINRRGKKYYYHGKILVKVDVVKSREQPERDTLEIRTRRRFVF